MCSDAKCVVSWARMCSDATCVFECIRMRNVSCREAIDQVKRPLIKVVWLCTCVASLWWAWMWVRMKAANFCRMYNLSFVFDFHFPSYLFSCLTLRFLSFVFERLRYQFVVGQIGNDSLWSLCRRVFEDSEVQSFLQPVSCICLLSNWEGTSSRCDDKDSCDNCACSGFGIQ